MQGVCWICSLTSILKKLLCEGISQRVRAEDKYLRLDYRGPKWVFPAPFFPSEIWVGGEVAAMFVLLLLARLRF